MSGLPRLKYRDVCVHAVAGCLLVAFSAGCVEDELGPTATAALPVDSAAVAAAPLAADSAAVTLEPVATTDELAAATYAPKSRSPGVVFGTFDLDQSLLNNVHTGWMQGGAVSPENVLAKLAATRAKGGRAIIKMSMGHDRYVQNGDRTFSVTKWKALVDRFKKVNLDPYIADGTLVAHYLMDEPHRTVRWGGRIVSQATLEEMAKHSKRNWPNLTTVVRVVPSWLGSANVNFVHLDAGWAQYAVGKGDAARWAASEAAAAKRKGLGLVVGLNVLDGGNGSSRIRGTQSRWWAMSASEIRSYGAAMLSQSHACGFYMWMHQSTYYNRSDIKSAMAEVSSKARSHPQTSCKQ